MFHCCVFGSQEKLKRNETQQKKIKRKNVSFFHGMCDSFSSVLSVFTARRLGGFDFRDKVFFISKGQKKAEQKIVFCALKETNFCYCVLAGDCLKTFVDFDLFFLPHTA